MRRDTQINVYLSPNAGSATFTIAGFAVDDIETVVAQFTEHGTTRRKAAESAEPGSVTAKATCSGSAK